MNMARPEKIAQVEAVEAAVNAARSIVLSDITGLNVAKVTELRRRCRAEGVELKVVKNTLAKRGVEKTAAAGLEKYFEGPTAIAFSRESENGAARVLAAFAKEHELPKLKAGFVDGNVIDAKGVLALSKLPGRGELVSQLMGGIQGPARNLLSVMQGPARNLASVLKQVSEKQS
jgi:large subunit ribosomal protein L10